MNRKSFIFAMVALILPTIAIMAQDDDDEMYFGRKSKNDKTVQSDKKQQTRRVVVEYEDDVTQPSNGEADYHTGTLRDVDEYNRRGRRTSVADTNTAVADTVVVTRRKQGSLYDLGYDDGYTRGYRDAEADGLIGLKGAIGMPRKTSSTTAHAWHDSVEYATTIPGIGTALLISMIHGTMTHGSGIPGIVLST